MRSNGKVPSGFTQPHALSGMWLRGIALHLLTRLQNGTEPVKDTVGITCTDCCLLDGFVPEPLPRHSAAGLGASNNHVRVLQQCRALHLSYVLNRQLVQP